MKRRALLVLASGGALLAGWLLLEGTRERTERRSRFLMDTLCTVSVLGEGGAEAAERALDRMEQLDRKLNALDPGSPLHAFNREGEAIVDAEVLEVAGAALRLSAETDGAFDVTVYPLARLWGFYGNQPTVPEPGLLDQALAEVGWRQLTLGHGMLSRQTDAARVDLGGIGKGYAVGAAVDELRRHGVQAALVDAGGDLFALGRPSQRPFRVGIRDPRGEGVVAILEVSDLAVFTSGDYERAFEEAGVRYHHILDPRTGRPARGLSSVTIVGPDPTLADALATAVFVLGREQGLAFVERVPQAEALLLDEHGEPHPSSGLDDLVKVRWMPRGDGSKGAE